MFSIDKIENLAAFIEKFIKKNIVTEETNVFWYEGSFETHLPIEMPAINLHLKTNHDLNIF